jgi:hypothetical protein
MTGLPESYATQLSSRSNKQSIDEIYDIYFMHGVELSGTKLLKIAADGYVTHSARKRKIKIDSNLSPHA